MITPMILLYKPNNNNNNNNEGANNSFFEQSEYEILFLSWLVQDDIIDSKSKYQNH